MGPREVRLKLIECLALGGEIADAFFLVSEYSFSPAFPRDDYPWAHIKGLVLALMADYAGASELLGKFKVVSPQDFPTVDEALWVLEGVYDRLKEDTNDERYGMDAKIVASLLKELKGIFSKEKYTTAAHLFPKWLPGDQTFFNALVPYIEGKFDQAKRILSPFKKHGLLSRSNRLTARVLQIECDLFLGEKITDEVIEDLLEISLEKTASPLLSEHIGFLLARYINGEDKEFKAGKLESEGQAFAKAITNKPCTLSLKYERGKIKPPSTPQQPRNRRKKQEEMKKEPEKIEKEPSKLIAEIYANRPDDWIVSATLNLVKLPEFSLQP
ncbi:hypothetical protein HYY75_10720 [bacterium]|nr:hypothetical protein [bacterium]